MLMTYRTKSITTISIIIISISLPYLTIDFNKCELLHFGNGNLYFPFKLSFVNLINFECEKILGVLINSSLSYCSHVYFCVKKASQACNVILSNMFFVNYETLVKLCKS